MAAAQTLDDLIVRPETGADSYNRRLYRYWVDADGDGQSTREEVLIAENLGVLNFNKAGKVGTGLWVGHYCGFVTTNPSTLDIDHLVPLKEAHESGAHSWSPKKRADYANDLTSSRSLIAVKNACNRSKGARDPAEWMPPNRAYWCQYVKDWITVKAEWGLSIDPAERDALQQAISICDQYRAGDALSGRH